MSWRVWTWLGLLAFLLFCTYRLALPATIFPSKYDSAIQTAVKKWWPEYPFWTAWKAELFAESRLDPNAKSSTGALGLAQFEPETWADVSRSLGFGTVSRTVAGPAIDGGAYYLGILRRSWSAPRPMDDRQRLGEASFNAGLGNILKAQRKCAGTLWPEISPCLIDITGPENSQQTVTYVLRIDQYRAMMRE